MRSDETLLTGDTAAKVTAAAQAKEPGATIERVETDSDGVYEAHMVRADGTHITVQVDASFAVTGVQEGGAGGGGGGRMGGDHDGDGPQPPPGSRASPGAEPVRGVGTARPAQPARPVPHRYVLERHHVDHLTGRSPPGGPSGSQRLPKTSRAADERFIVMKWMPGAPSSRRRRDDSEAIAIPSARTPPRRPRAGRAGR